VAELTSNLFTGPGSQPQEDDVVLEYMQMPQGMMTYHMPSLPEKESVSGLGPALQKLDEVLAALEHFKNGAPSYVVDLAGLDDKNLAFINEALGEGEVSIVGGAQMQAQESVLAGVWRVHTMADDGAALQDIIEIGHMPAAVHDIAFGNASTLVRSPEGAPAEMLLAAPSLLAEVSGKLATGGDDARHSINLSLLPHTEEDLVFLDAQFGKGLVHILSRGYGNCRISSTTTRNVWWVRFYNSQDALILNSLEVARIPEVAFAAIEDVHDSAQRLREILDVYR
jgi:hydrogenase-1 operon protein HyaF